MKIEESKTDYILITDYKGLDPVHVWVQDIAKNQGRIVIVCYNCTLMATWGSMGKTIKEFFVSASESYIFNVFEHNIRDSYDVVNYQCGYDENDKWYEKEFEGVGNKMSAHQKDYIYRIIKCVKECFVKQLGIKLNSNSELLEAKC